MQPLLAVGKWAMRAAIYARFSTDLQSDRSIDDQVALCRSYAEKQGWQIVEVFPDYAVSGSHVHGRFAFERMVGEARRRAFDLILAEDIDRLSRNQADIAGLYERMNFDEVQLWTAADGRLSELHIGLKGTMSALFIKTLALKTHRGLRGRAVAGKSAGGRSYGYRVTAVGERAIEPDQAAIVLRIVDEALSGRSPREIAAKLNTDGIAGPSGGEWTQSTINGSRKRGNGVLRNELYAGCMVWNRQRFIKDPDTGKRISRPNADSVRVVTDVPELRIVDPEKWDRLQAMLAERADGHKPGQRRRPKHLLSGLCRCGNCGGSFTVMATNQLGCSAVRERGTCSNRRRVSIKLIEDRILSALQEHLLHEDIIAAAVEEYVAERKRLARNIEAEIRKRDKRLGEIKREQNRILDMVVKFGATDEQGRRMQELEGERKRLAELALPAKDAIAIHPSIAERYRVFIRDIRRGLDAASSEDRTEIFTPIRGLIEQVVVYPRDDKAGRDIELHGTLAALLGVTEQGRSSMGKLVAGTRFGRTHTFPAIKIAVRSR